MKHLICVILLSLMPTLLIGQIAECRNCGLTINTSIEINSERLRADSLSTVSGGYNSLDDFIKSAKGKFAILIIIRVGDRPAWVKRAVVSAKAILRECKNVSIALLFLDTDSILARQTYPMLCRQVGSQNFELFYTTSYIKDFTSSKIPRWNIESTPAICIFDIVSGKNKVLYVAMYNLPDVLEQISSWVHCEFE